jgi:ubiquinone/menaquinone biosynthesis C-methylase UbiE
MTTMNPAQIYQDVMVPVIFDPWADELLAAVDVASGSSVLDVACGTGAVTRKAAVQAGTDGHVVGLDISPFMLDIARSVAVPGDLPIEWLEGSAVDMPLEAETFDVVLCQQGLQFTPDKQAAASEFHRVLKAKGQLGLAVWDTIDQNQMMNALNESSRKILGKGGFETPFAFSDAGAIRDTLFGAGFRNIQIETVKLKQQAFEPEKFTRISIMGATAVLPEMKDKSPEEMAEIAKAIQTDLASYFEESTVDAVFEFDMQSMIITASK